MNGRSRRKPARSNYAKDLERFIEVYILATGDQAWTTFKIADWLIKTGQWEDRQINSIRYLSRQLSAAARQATITDENGNRIRRYHAYRLGPQQPMLWSEMESIHPEQMSESKTMRRNKLAAGNVQLWLDLDYYNKHHNPGEPILFDPDYSNDIAERTQSDDYDDTPPEDDQL
ncbi:hypothetical protein SAMN05444166_0174 [Singulisphaera sp. GP187]|uniref:hypothetical protein n=1 Tax=Singulisphaera sp. GP187 TaxID=1882752 RepID=UPI000927AF3F|nr:hypothetical protein [Singulisphaera sp. GP187]SIN69418.1 hypothetical protein SAMN05444166_0174 [Singulisphaera sp. GP187]